ncbi:MAG: TIGR03619 family F420-dependent LLM class oxidoreductase [Proteobacteria bacterium]|nr:TIGR03619 family F420-dependent LLM class oxidoreductase [Pseudomonadota bacterium]
MQYWQALGYEHPEDMIEIARVAEEAGFEGLLLSDHVFAPERVASAYPYSDDGTPHFPAGANFPDALMTIAVLAQHTERLRFATSVYILPLRHPVEVARFVGSAAVYSNDRAVLGVGAGWMREEFDVLGRGFERRGASMDEAIEVIRKLLSGEVVEHQGENWSFPPMRLLPAPRRDVPIWMGGHNPAALRRAGRLADGWSGLGHSFAEAERILLRLGAIRREAGRGDRPFDALVPLVESIDADQRRRLVELGMTGSVQYPFPDTIGPGASQSQKLDHLRRLGDELIAKDRTP